MGKNDDLELRKVEILGEIKYQFDVIISLLAQKFLNPDDIKKEVSKGRQDPKKTINTFNACDGKTNISDIAKKFKINKGNIRRDVESWEKSGYMIKIEKEGKVFPKALILLK